MTYDEAIAGHNSARLGEIDAQLDIMQLEAAAREDQEGVTATFELRVASECVRRLLGNLSMAEPENRQELQQAALRNLRELESAIAAAREREAASDGAGTHDVRSRLAEGEARLRLWRARQARAEAELDLRRCELLLAVQERAALARAHEAETDYDRYQQLAQDALAEAARHFNEAFDAAAKRHQLSKAEP